MDRSIAPDRMLRALKGSGLEIGALQAPQFLPEGNVRYVDLLSRSEALRYYPEVHELIPVIEPDILSPADDLSVVEASSQDFVIASHLLEHVTDPVGTLIEWRRVIRDGGLLYLCLPDKRNTFDAPRERTSIDHVIADHAATAEDLHGRNVAHYREWARHVNGLGDPAQAAFWADLLQRAHYPIHFHCWEPDDLPPILTHIAQAHGARFEILDTESMRDAYEFALLLKAC